MLNLVEDWNQKSKEYGQIILSQMEGFLLILKKVENHCQSSNREALNSDAIIKHK